MEGTVLHIPTEQDTDSYGCTYRYKPQRWNSNVTVTQTVLMQERSVARIHAIRTAVGSVPVLYTDAILTARNLS